MAPVTNISSKSFLLHRRWRLLRKLFVHVPQQHRLIVSVVLLLCRWRPLRELLARLLRGVIAIVLAVFTWAGRQLDYARPFRPQARILFSSLSWFFSTPCLRSECSREVPCRWPWQEVLQPDLRC